MAHFSQSADLTGYGLAPSHALPSLSPLNLSTLFATITAVNAGRTRTSSVSTKSRPRLSTLCLPFFFILTLLARGRSRMSEGIRTGFIAHRGPGLVCVSFGGRTGAIFAGYPFAYAKDFFIRSWAISLLLEKSRVPPSTLTSRRRLDCICCLLRL